MNEIQYGNRTLCNLSTFRVWPSLQGSSPVLHTIFNVDRYFYKEYFDEYKFNNLSIINCYGVVNICGIDVSTINHPTFFKVQSHLPEFRFSFDRDLLTLIEEERKQGLVHVNYKLNLLYSFDVDSMYTFRDVNELSTILTATISKSEWIEEFLPKWDYYGANEIIIPLSNFNSRTSVKEHIVEARKSFAYGKYRETMSAVYRAMEALAKGLGHQKIGDLFRAINNYDSSSKGDALSKMFNCLPNYLNMGRHDQTIIQGNEENKEFTKDDARLALIYGQAIIDYIMRNEEKFSRL